MYNVHNTMYLYILVMGTVAVVWCVCWGSYRSVANHRQTYDCEETRGHYLNMMKICDCGYYCDGPVGEGWACMPLPLSGYLVLKAKSTALLRTKGTVFCRFFKQICKRDQYSNVLQFMQLLVTLGG